MTVRKLKLILFSVRERNFPGQRWINILLRSVHLVGIAGAAAGFLFDVDSDLWTFYWRLTLSSGVLLSLLYLWSSALWLFQIKGLAILLKLGLLWLATVSVEFRAQVFVLIVLISGLSAHAPGNVRGFFWLPQQAVRHRCER
ncbi:MAG: hypothetical protein G8D58_13720 [gamma proteobacterium symbiont of Phacoides pectinatus]